jgi:GNAT superfamily N-acetyltransferase
MHRLVTTTYLEMTNRAALRPAARAKTAITLTRVEIPCPEFNRFLYTAVGARWWWYTRLSWDYARWRAYLNRPELETWVAYVSGSPAGYFELEGQEEGNVEIAYFGLLPGFVGKGVGGELLTAAITRAWDMGAARVWVHTCDLDHPSALPNYQARGLRVFRVEQRFEDLPDRPPEPWLGANQA